MRTVLRVCELLLLYSAFCLLYDADSMLERILAIGYLYFDISLIIAIEWTLLPVLSLVYP
jgi:hypothetical protein